MNDISIERKKKRKERERICNEKARDQACEACTEEKVSFTRLVYEPNAKERARKIESGSLLLLGLGHGGESGRSRCMVGHRIGDRRSRSRLSPPPRKSVEW